MNSKDFFDIKNEVVKLFLLQEKKYKENDIVNVELLKNGFTNISCLLETKNHDKYVIRLGNPSVNRKNEWLYILITGNTDYLYFNLENGNSIKKWIEGRVATIDDCNNSMILSEVCDQIKQLHSYQRAEIQQMSIKNYYEFINIAQLDDHIKEVYKKILDKYKHLKLVISHNDIRPSNMLLQKNRDKEKLVIIDYEWSSLNNEYWDLANYIREIKYDFNEIETLLKNKFDYLNMDILKEFLFVTTCYAVQWTYFPKETPDIIKYRENAKDLMNQYFEQYCKHKYY